MVCVRLSVTTLAAVWHSWSGLHFDDRASEKAIGRLNTTWNSVSSESLPNLESLVLAVQKTQSKFQSSPESRVQLLQLPQKLCKLHTQSNSKPGLLQKRQNLLLIHNSYLPVKFFVFADTFTLLVENAKFQKLCDC